MSESAPTPQAARASLAEASTQAARVRRADSQFRWMLIAIAAIYLVGAGLASGVPRPWSTLAGVLLVMVVFGGVAAILVVGRRIRAYTRSGLVGFLAAISAFLLWNALVTGVSLMTGWWAPHQPGYHLVVSEAVGVIPLIVGALLLGRR